MGKVQTKVLSILLVMMTLTNTVSPLVAYAVSSDSSELSSQVEDETEASIVESSSDAEESVEESVVESVVESVEESKVESISESVKPKESKDNTTKTEDVKDIELPDFVTDFSEYPANNTTSSRLQAYNDYIVGEGLYDKNKDLDTLLTNYRSKPSNRFTKNDFIISEREITGFSASGLAKIKRLPILHLNGDVLYNIDKIADHAFFNEELTDEQRSKLGVEYIGIQYLIVETPVDIGKHAFQNTGLRMFEGYYKQIEDYAFADNKLLYLQTLDATNNTIIGNYAFKGNQLHAVVSNARDIGVEAFSSNKLELVDLNNTQDIGSGAFKYNNLEEIMVRSTKYTMASNALDYNTNPVSVQSPNYQWLSAKKTGYLVNPTEATLNVVDTDGNALAEPYKQIVELRQSPYIFDIPKIPGYTYPENSYSTTSLNSTMVMVKADKPYFNIFNTKPRTTLRGVEPDLKDGIYAIDSKGGTYTNYVVTGFDANKLGEQEVKYTFTDSHTGEVIYTKVIWTVTETDIMKEEFAPGWRYEDFTYLGQGLSGLSDTGKAKVAQGLKLVLPAKNPTTSLPITEIRYGAFQYLSITGGIDLRLLTELEVIGGAVFENSKIGGTLDLSNNKKLKEIGSYAFSRNNFTGNLDLSALTQLESIDSYAFHKTTFKGTLTFGNLQRLTEIGRAAFSDSQFTGNLDLSGLTRLTTIERNAFSNSSFNGSLLMNDLRHLTSIGSGAFANNNLTGNLNLSGLRSLREIGSYAFRDNQFVGSIRLENLPSLERVESHSFSNNKFDGSIQFIDLPKLEALPTYFMSGNDVFKGGLVLRNLPLISTIPTSFLSLTGFEGTLEVNNLPNLISITDSVFAKQGFTGSLILTQLPSLTSIDTRAFYNNKFTGDLDLSELTNLTSIGNEAFNFNDFTGSLKLTGLTKLVSIGSKAFYLDRSSRSGFTGTLNLNDLISLQVIGSEAFRRNKFTGDLNLSNLVNLKSIGKSSFANNPFTSLNLTKLTKLETIGDYAFLRNKLGGRLNFKDLTSLKTIGDSAFKGNLFTGKLDFTGLTNLVDMGDSAFSENNFSGSLDFTPLRNLEYLGGYNFQGGSFTSTADMTVHENKFTGNLDLSPMTKLKTIGTNAFENTALTGSLDLRANKQLETIGSGAFQASKFTGGINLNGLNKLRIIGILAFDDLNLTGTLDLRGLSSLEEIGLGAFTNNYLTGEVNLSQSPNLKEIGMRAFTNNRFTGVNLSNKTGQLDVLTGAFMENGITSLNISNIPNGVNFVDVSFRWNRMKTFTFNNTKILGVGQNSFEFDVDTLDFRGKGSSLTKTVLDSSNIKTYYFDTAAQIDVSNLEYDGTSEPITIFIANNDTNNDGRPDLRSGPGYIVNPVTYNFKFQRSTGSKVADDVTIRKTSEESEFIPPIVRYMRPSTGNITLEYDQLSIVNRNQTITYVSDYTTVPGAYQYTLSVTRTGNRGVINTSTGVASALVAFRVNGSSSLPSESKIVVQLPNYIKDITVSKLTDGTVTDINVNHELRQITYTLKNLRSGYSFESPIQFNYVPMTTPKTNTGVVNAKYIIDGKLAREANSTSYKTDYSPLGSSVNLRTKVRGVHINGKQTDDGTGTITGTENDAVYDIATSIQREARLLEHTITLPTYQAYENGRILSKKATFDPAKNPGWTLSSTGKTVVHNADLDKTYWSVSLSGTYVGMARPLTLTYPNAINQTINIPTRINYQLKDPVTGESGITGTLSDQGHAITNENTYDGNLFSLGTDKKTHYTRENDFSDLNKQGLNWFVGMNMVEMEASDTTLGVLGYENIKLITPDLDNNFKYKDFTPTHNIRYTLKSGKNNTGTTLATGNISAGQTFTLTSAQKNSTKTIIFEVEGVQDPGQQIRVRVGTEVANPATFNVNQPQYLNTLDGSATVIYDSPKTTNIALEPRQPSNGSLTLHKYITQVNRNIEAFVTGENSNSDLVNPRKIIYSGEGQTEKYTIGFNTTNSAKITDIYNLNDFKQYNILPDGVTVKSIELNNTFKQHGGKYDVITHNGKTILVFSAPSVTTAITHIAEITLDITSDLLVNKIYTNETFIEFSNTSITSKNMRQQPSAGYRNLSTARVAFEFDKNRFASLQKTIKGTNGVWSRDIETVPNELIEYRLLLDNSVSQVRTGVQLLDILPYQDDYMGTIDENGVRYARGSDFSNRFVRVKSITQINASGTRTNVKSSYPIRYVNNRNNLPSKSSAMSMTDWLNTQTLSTTPSNPAAVVIGTGSNTLPAQSQLEVIIEMRAPNYSMSNADTWVGTSAKNTASRRDDSTLMFLESSSVSNTMVPTSRDLIFNKQDNSGNKLAGAVFALKDANNITIETAISNTNGQVVFRDVPYGQTYRVEEVTAPVGYIRSNVIFAVTDSHNSNTGSSLRTFVNDKIVVPPITPEIDTPKPKYQVAVNKTRVGSVFPNVTFALHNLGTGDIISRVTNTQGKISFTGLNPGVYELREVRAGNNVVLMEPRMITITTSSPTITKVNVDNNRFNAVLTKIGLDTTTNTKDVTTMSSLEGLPLSGVQFRLRRGTTDLGVYTTNNNGEVVLPNLISNTIYSVEELNTPTGYQKLTGRVQFKVSTAGQVMTTANKTYYENTLLIPNLRQPETGSLVVTKINSVTRQPLAGADFRLYRLNNATGSYATYSTQKTGSTGVLLFDNLPAGQYRLEEIASPQGYLHETRQYDFTVDEQTPNQVFRTTYENEPIGLTFAKVDESGNPLTGAQFRLADLNGNTIAPTTINQTGQTRYTYNNLDLTKRYVLTETKTPTGYDPVSPMEVDTRLLINTATPRNTVNVTNTRIKGQVIINKYQLQNGQVLSGAQFGLYRVGQSTPIKTVTTDASGSAIFNDLDLGNYYVREISAPTGYELDLTSQSVVLTASNRVQVVSLYNKKEGYDQVVQKIDGTTGNPLAGATFQLRDKDTNAVVSNATTDASGRVIFRDLQDGRNYIVQEIVAPAGYQMNNTIYDVVKGKTITVDNYNLVTVTIEHVIAPNYLSKGGTQFNGSKVVQTQEVTVVNGTTVNATALANTNPLLQDNPNNLHYRFARQHAFNVTTGIPSLINSPSNTVSFVANSSRNKVTLYYEPYRRRVNLVHKELLMSRDAATGNTTFNGRDGTNLHVTSRWVDIGNEKYTALGDRDPLLGNGVNPSNYNYLYKYSINKGNTVVDLPGTRTYTHSGLDWSVDTVYLYYAQPAQCPTGFTQRLTSSGELECSEELTGNGNDKFVVYDNNYLRKDIVNKDQSDVSDAVYNGAGFIQDTNDYFAVTQVVMEAINHRDSINSDVSGNNKTKVYLTDRATNFNVPKSLDNPTNTIRGTITNIPTNAGSVKNELSYTGQDLTTDMTTWSDNLAVTTHVDNEDLTDTSRPVSYRIKGQFITGIKHRYEPSVIINGVAYGGTYQESELASDRRQEYGITNRLANNYSGAYGKVKDSTRPNDGYLVGREDLILGPTEHRTKNYSERIGIKNTPNIEGVDGTPTEVDTQQGIDISEVLTYSNELEKIDMPYVTSTTKLRDEDKQLQFNRDEMYYLVDDVDDDSAGIDSANIKNTLTGSLKNKVLNLDANGNLPGTRLYDSLDPEHVYQLDYDIYETYEPGIHALGITTDQIFSVGRDSGLQVAVDVKHDSTATDVSSIREREFGRVPMAGVLDGASSNQKGKVVNSTVADAAYEQALVNLGIDVTGIEEDLITNNDGAMYYIPLNRELDTVYNNRMVIGQIGLNDFVLVRDDVFTADKYLYGFGDEAIYTPQRREISSGEAITIGNMYNVLNKALAETYRELLPSDKQKTVHGTRIMYGRQLNEVFN